MIRIEISEALWLDTGPDITLAELAERSGLPQEMLRQLAELEALPVRDAAGATFGTDCLALACAARRLQDDFALDADALALVLRLLGRVRELEAQLRTLRAHLPHDPT
jgi:hypothetical protein